MLEKLPFILAVVLLLFCANSEDGRAQTDEHKFEVGALFTAINLDDFESRLVGVTGLDSTVKGLGGRFGYNITEHFALDAEASFFPETAFDNNQVGQKTQALIGVRAGARSKRAGIFAKARPGVMTFYELTTRSNCRSVLAGIACGQTGQSNFAFDVGGVIELYPSKRTIVRFDFGDTIVHFRERTVSSFVSPFQTASNTTHNFQASIGFGYRF